jgi:hypothetical protein
LAHKQPQAVDAGAIQDQELCNQHNQVAQVAEQVAIQVHHKDINQANQEYQVKATQAEILETKVVAVVAVPLAQVLQVEDQDQLDQVELVYHYQLPDLLRHMQAAEAVVIQAQAQADQAVAAMAGRKADQATMLHTMAAVAAVAGITATQVVVQAIKE